MDDGPNDRLEEILLIGAVVLAVLIAVAVILLVARALAPGAPRRPDDRMSRAAFYLRVSTREQTTENQERELRAAWLRGHGRWQPEREDEFWARDEVA